MKRFNENNSNDKCYPLAVIIGMPAAGKTRVGREVANIMHVPFLDTDIVIEEKIEMSVSQYFEQYGQDAFRKVEAQVVRDAIEGDNACTGIVSLGGGAPMNESTQNVLRKYKALGGKIVYLQANPQEAIERAGRNNNRPMLSGSDGAERWMELFKKRNPVFSELANMHVRTHGATPRLAAEKVRSMIMQHIVHVTGEGIEPYDVRIGDGVMQLLPQILGEKPVRVALVHTQPVQRHSDKARTILRQSGYEVFDMIIPVSYTHLTLPTN